MEGNRILLVEDSEAIVMGLTYLLSQEGFMPVAAKSVAQAKQKVLEGEYVLALLDVSLPDGDGFEFCRWMKEKRGDVPVIFLTAKEEEIDVVKGFDLGADDYVIKPFRNRELISRIRNVLRRRKPESVWEKAKLLRCGPICMDVTAGKVRNNDEEIELTKLEFRILSSMMARPGKVFTREEILAQVWDSYGNFVNDNTLSVTMKRIREKIGDSDGKIIKTVRGIGYRLDERE